MLARITQGLQADPRILAAWLIGSYGRGEQDVVSDIDLVLAVDPSLSGKHLYAWTQPVSAGALRERFALFSQFGNPVNIHENHANAQTGGSFSAVLYSNPPVIVDWSLTPADQAWRIMPSRLLFCRSGYSPHNHPSQGLVQALAASRGLSVTDQKAERGAFFWMMAMVTAKYIIRGDAAAIEWALQFLTEVVKMAESLSGVVSGAAELENAMGSSAVYLRRLCDRMEKLSGGSVAARICVETVLQLR